MLEATLVLDILQYMKMIRKTLLTLLLGLLVGNSFVTFPYQLIFIDSLYGCVIHFLSPLLPLFINLKLLPFLSYQSVWV